MRTSSFEDFAKNRVSFITFNYDRSLEYFLCRSLADTYGKSEFQASQIIKQLPIKHLHGQLGYLPWQQGDSSRPYGQLVDRAGLAACAQLVKVVNRNIEPDAAVFNQAKELIANARSVYFLGVGFYNLNMSRLGVFGFPQNKTASTGTGLTDREYSDLISRFGTHLRTLKDVNCIGVLRNYIDWSAISS
jgi:hypothetical protein